MRGAPRQWDVGSLWIGDGGVYPGMGDSIALAGTSPELVQDGLWNDGGAVGDPPFDTAQGAYFDSSIGAGSPGTARAIPIDNGGVGDAASGEILLGLGVVAVAALGVTWLHHRFHVGDSDRFASIRGTAGDFFLIGVGGYAVIPLIKSGVTWLADITDWNLLHAAATYGNAS